MPNYDLAIGLVTKLASRTTGYVILAVGMVLFLIWLIFFRLPSTYSAMPVSGRVVDTDTGKPLEGAIVIAIWQLERGFGLEGTIPSGFMQVSEVLTDEEGNYSIEGWGPLRRPRGTYLGKSAPLLVYFKDGYVNTGHLNYMSRMDYDNRRDKIQHSQWNGETIRLKRFEGDIEAYYRVLKSVSSSLNVLFNPLFRARPCDWKNVPEIVAVFDKYHQLLIQELGSERTYFIPNIERLRQQGECGIKK